MARFFTSDQHFGHDRILELGSGRPFRSIYEHNDFLVKRWIETVSVEDTVYVLGDVAFGGGKGFEKNVNIFSWLPGEKFLIPGNHDRIWSGNSVNYREKYHSFYVDAGFTILDEKVVHNFPLNNNETIPVVLSHIPYSDGLSKQKDVARKSKFVKQTPKDEGLPLIHGHTHSSEKLSHHVRSFHVGVDAHGFTPVHEDEIREWLINIL